MTLVEPVPVETPQPGRQDVYDLCRHLADNLAANGVRNNTITQQWRDEARRLLDRDQRDPDEAHRLIDWCTADNFWRTNILSMPTFRKQYDKLRLRARLDTPQPPVDHRDLTPAFTESPAPAATW